MVEDGHSTGSCSGRLRYDCCAIPPMAVLLSGAIYVEEGIVRTGGASFIGNAATSNGGTLHTIGAVA